MGSGFGLFGFFGSEKLKVIIMGNGYCLFIPLIFLLSPLSEINRSHIWADEPLQYSPKPR